MQYICNSTGINLEIGIVVCYMFFHFVYKGTRLN